MSDLIAAILGYLSSRYSHNKLSKFALSLTTGILFFVGYFIVEILGQISRNQNLSVDFMVDLIRDLTVFSSVLFFLCYVFLWIAEKIEAWRKNR